MTRRDTIIVAVLINAGLLVMLFISALKNENQPVLTSNDKKVEKQQVVAKKETPLAKSNSDQVDQLLAQYSKKNTKEPVKEEKKIEVAVASKVQEIQENKVTQERQSIEKIAASMQMIEKKSLENPAIQKVKETSVKEVTSKETSSDEVIKVIVKKGDVLEKIAKTYGTTVGALMQVNQLTDSRLQIGQVLHIPKEKQTIAPSTIKALPILEDKYYVVKNGDNLWKIAIENHMKVEDLLQLNQLNEKQARALRPGDRLRIR